MRTVILILTAVFLLNSAGFANSSESGDTIPPAHMHHDMSNMQMNDTVPHDQMHHDMNNMQMNDSSMNMAHSHNMEDMNMPMGNMTHSFSLNLPMNRNGSGTGWSPDAAPMYGTMYHSKNWMYMVHYNLFIRYNKQDLANKGSRGDAMVDAPNWLMFMGQRKVGENGLFRFGTMFSLDAVITYSVVLDLVFTHDMVIAIFEVQPDVRRKRGEREKKEQVSREPHTSMITAAVMKWYALSKAGPDHHRGRRNRIWSMRNRRKTVAGRDRP